MRYKIVIDSCGELVEKWKDSPAVESTGGQEENSKAGGKYEL